MKERLSAFDILRVIATFTVIGIHVTASYVLVSPAGYLGNQLARFAVPLFIIMSGFLLQYADLNTPMAPAVFFRKRFNRILWPYFLWSFLYICVTAFLSGKSSEALKALPENLLWGTSFYHLYFVIIIIQLYVLYPLLRRLLDKHLNFGLIASFLLTLFCQIALYQNMLGRIALPAAYNMIYLVCFPVWIFYFVMGMAAARVQKPLNLALTKHSALMGIIWLISFIILLADSHYTASYGSSIRPTVMLYTVSSYFFFYSLATHFRNPLPSWISWISNQSFMIFLMHPLFLTAAVWVAGRMDLPNLWNRTRGMAALYLIVTLITLLATYLVSLTPLADKLGGRRHLKTLH